MRCPLLGVVRMQNVEAAYFAHVAVQIRAGVSVVTLARCQVRAQLRVRAHVRVSAGGGRTLQPGADGVQVSVRLTVSAVVSVVPALRALSSAVCRSSAITTQSCHTNEFNSTGIKPTSFG